MGNSHALTEKNYPTPEEQHRFLKAYIQHQPPIQPSTSSAEAPPASTSPRTSTLTPTNSRGGSSSISSFILDSRSPPAAGSYAEEDRQRNEAIEAEIQRLRRETRLWRVACSAQWVAWGIVQAKVPGMNAALAAARVNHPSSLPEPALPPSGTVTEDRSSDDDDDDGEEEEHFDNLWYARDRVLLFWGDVLQLGIVTREELPADLLAEVKIIEY